MDGKFISYVELRNLEPQNYGVIADFRRHYEDELETILISGAVAGCFPILDTRVAAMALIAMLTGVNIWFRSGGRLSCERVIHVSLLHNYRGSVGRGKPFGSARVVTPDPVGARGVSAG